MDRKCPSCGNLFWGLSPYDGVPQQPSRLTNHGDRSRFAGVKFAKIQFEERSVAAKALVGLGQRCRIVGLPERVFIVPEPELAWLTENALPYKLIEFVNQDDVLQTLRSAPANSV